MRFVVFILCVFQFTTVWATKDLPGKFYAFTCSPPFDSNDSYDSRSQRRDQLPDFYFIYTDRKTVEVGNELQGSFEKVWAAGNFNGKWEVKELNRKTRMTYDRSLGIFHNEHLVLNFLDRNTLDPKNPVTLIRLPTRMEIQEELVCNLSKGSF